MNKHQLFKYGIIVALLIAWAMLIMPAGATTCGITGGVSFTAVPDHGDAPLSVQFTDTTIYWGSMSKTFNWERQRTGSWTSFSTAQNPPYVFNDVGDYHVRLTVSYTCTGLGSHGSGSESHQYPHDIEVTQPNRAPVANDQSVSTPENTAKAITLVATDADSDPLTYSIVSGPSHGILGSLTGTPNHHVIYTPGENYVGSDSFTFKANDGHVDSNIAMVTITVNAATCPTHHCPEGSVCIDHECVVQSFSFSPEAPTDCGPVTFTRTNTEDGHYHFYFGDGTDEVVDFEPGCTGTLTTTHQYLSPDTYHVVLKSMHHGSGWYDDGVMGTLDVPVTYGPCDNHAVSGMKFADVNQNGVKDAGEVGIADYTINLCPVVEDGGCQHTTTDINGNYAFTGVLPGNYVVSEVLKAGDTQKAPATNGGTYPIAVDGEGISGLDFGNFNPSMLPPSDSAPPMQFTDPYWVGTTEQCAGLGGSGATPLVSYDNERLYVTLTHDGFFDAQVITHDPESDDMFLQGCKGHNYFRSTCSIERLSGVGVLSFTITGTRDFRVIAVPSIMTDDRPTLVAIINHAVDYSSISSGRILDQKFMRTQGMAGCPGASWLSGISFYGPN